MLKITIPGADFYDEVREEFVTTKDHTLVLEHSLVSLSKWEAKWHKPFLSQEPKTHTESIDYIRCMTVTQNVDPLVYNAIPTAVMHAVDEYIADPMTATSFNERDNRKFSREVITSELIYYWMVALQIPFECEKWHLNRLLTLIRICNIKNAPAKNMGKRELINQNRSLNALRRKRLNSHG